MKRLAIRAVCKIAAPRLVLELTKNVRIGLRAESGLELRDGRAMAGRDYKRLPLLFCRSAPLLLLFCRSAPLRDGPAAQGIYFFASGRYD